MGTSISLVPFTFFLVLCLISVTFTLGHYPSGTNRSLLFWELGLWGPEPILFFQVELLQGPQTADTLGPCGLCHYPPPWTLLYLRAIALKAWAIPGRARGTSEQSPPVIRSSGGHRLLSENITQYMLSVAIYLPSFHGLPLLCP